MMKRFNVLVWDARDYDSPEPGSTLEMGVTDHEARVRLARYLMGEHGRYITYAVIENAADPMDYESFGLYGTGENR